MAFGYLGSPLHSSCGRLQKLQKLTKPLNGHRAFTPVVRFNLSSYRASACLCVQREILLLQICPSVRPSHSDVSKRKHILKLFSPFGRGMTSFFFLSAIAVVTKFQLGTASVGWGIKHTGVGKICNRNCRYLGNGTR